MVFMDLVLLPLIGELALKWWLNIQRPAIADQAAAVMAAGDEFADGEVEELNFHVGLDFLVVGDFDKADDVA